MFAGAEDGSTGGLGMNISTVRGVPVEKNGFVEIREFEKTKHAPLSCGLSQPGMEIKQG